MPDVDTYLLGELQRCQNAYEASVKIALIDALWLCEDHPEITPHWLLRAVLEFMISGLGSSAAGKAKGRTGNALAAYRADMIHYDRWATVKYVRDVQDRDRRGGNTPVRYNLTGARSRGAREVVEPGKSWEVAFRNAAALLRGSAAQGSPGTMKASYQLVERESKNGNGSRFHIPVSPALMSLLEPRQG